MSARGPQPHLGPDLPPAGIVAEEGRVIVGKQETPPVCERRLLLRGVVLTVVGWLTVLASLGVLMLVFVVGRHRLDRVVARADPAGPFAHVAVLLGFIALLVLLVAAPVGASTLPATERFRRMRLGRIGIIVVWLAWLLLSLAGWAGSIGRLSHAMANGGFGTGLLLEFLLGVFVVAAVAVPLLVRATLIAERRAATRLTSASTCSM